MLQQLIQFIQGSFIQWLMKIELGDSTWVMLGRLYSGIGVLISWTPDVPYVPFTAMWFSVSVVISTWLLLFGVGIIITWAAKLKP